MPMIPDNLQRIHQRIASACQSAGRDTHTVNLLAVSKKQPVSAIRQAASAGQTAFGENYLQEALDKQEKLQDLSLIWHFIGPIQSNKTRPIAQNFDWVHSVDRLKVAQRLSDQRPLTLPPLNICLQVNLDEEASKSGIDLTELPVLAQQVAQLPNLALRGLMAIPARREDPNTQQLVFEQLSEALLHLQQLLPDAPLDTLSMGMSGDMEAAIAAGSTMVRIGTDIFGERQY